MFNFRLEKRIHVIGQYVRSLILFRTILFGLCLLISIVLFILYIFTDCSSYGINHKHSFNIIPGIHLLSSQPVAKVWSTNTVHHLHPLDTTNAEKKHFGKSASVEYRSFALLDIVVHYHF